MKVIKLDRRYSGYGTWTHRTNGGHWYGHDARMAGLLAFYEMRCYLTKMNGNGCFIHEASALTNAGREVPEWAWDTDGNIFLRGSALVNFQLIKDKWNV